MKNKTVVKVLWYIIGGLFIITGILSMINPHNTLISLVTLFGIVMLIGGMINILIFIKWHNVIYGGGWLLADGMLTMLLSIFVLFNNSLAAITIPVIFSSWVIFAGIIKVIHSIDLKEFAIKGWGYITCLGLVEILLGILLVIKPVVAVLAISIIIGIAFIYQGLSMISFSLMANRVIKGINERINLQIPKKK